MLGIAKLEDKIDTLIAEFKPNGGSSIKDALSRIEQRQLFSLARQKSLMQTDPRPIFEADLEGNFIWVNTAFLRLVDVANMDAVKARGWLTFIPEVAPDWDLAVQDRRSFRGEVHVGEEKRLMESYVLRDDHGEPIGFLGYVL